MDYTDGCRGLAPFIMSVNWDLDVYFDEYFDVYFDEYFDVYFDVLMINVYIITVTIPSAY